MTCADEPNEVWTSTATEWLYLTIMLELFSCEIIGYACNFALTTETTVLPALAMAVMNRKPAAGLIMHSDRGAQYTCKDFREKLEKYKMIQSMGSTGNC